MDLMVGTDNGMTTLAWLVGALDHARTHNQTKLVDYLETIADDMVFQMESAARSHRLRARTIQERG